MKDLALKFESIKDKADKSEEKVKTICSEIKSHDNAKWNIHTAISALKNLIMLSKYKIIFSNRDRITKIILYWLKI